MGLPVTTVASGGLAVTETALGAPVTEATSGIAVTKVAAGGLPVNYGVTDTAEATAYLARTSGLDATHTNAYKALINGLVADGVFAKLDVLYIFANQDTTTALLNLVQNNYNGNPAAGMPNFVVDAGFQGSDGNRVIRTGFIPSEVVSPRMAINSASIFAWNKATVGGRIIGTGSNLKTGIWFSSSTEVYGFVNGTGFGLTKSPIADCSGLWVANRSGASSTQLYQGATEIDTDTLTSDGSLPGAEIAALQFADTLDTTSRVAACGFGASLSAADVGALNARLTTCLAAVAPAFSPADLPGLIWWLEADAGVTHVAGAVSAWADQAGVQPALVQATSSQQPQYSATGFNGHPGISFTIAGGPDHLKTTSFALGATTTWSLFILNFPVTGCEVNSGVISFVPTGASADYTATEDGIALGTYADFTEIVYQDGGLGKGAQPTAFLGSGVPLWFGVTANGTTAQRLYEGGVEQGLPTTKDATIGKVVGTGTMTLGTRPWNGNTPSFQGTIAAVFMGNQVWTQAQIDALTDYVNSKYGTSFAMADTKPGEEPDHPTVEPHKSRRR